MHLHNDYKFLQKDALWVIVDPWLNQPEKDQLEFLYLVLILSICSSVLSGA